MLANISNSLAIPRGFRLIGHWLVRGIYVAFLALLLLLFARVLLTMRESHSHWLNPGSHMPMSPDSISYHSSRKDDPRRVSED